MRKPNVLWSYCRGGASQRARFTLGSGAHTAERLPLRPALTGSRVVSGAPRSCQNAHDITHIINNYRLSTDGRADGHTATEICLISARPFPDIFPRAHSRCLPGGKILMKKNKRSMKENCKCYWRFCLILPTSGGKTMTRPLPLLSVVCATCFSVSI